jgi:hypothetical protein
MRAPMAAFVAGLLFTTTAFASGVPIPTKQDKIVFVGGVLKAGGHSAFKRALKSARPDVIAFHGPDGDILEAISIASDIRRRGLNTFVSSDDPCGSACAIMFLAGKTKYATLGARIGFQSAHYAQGSASKEGSAPVAHVLSQLGVPADIITGMHTVGPTRMYWLTSWELHRIGVVTLSSNVPNPLFRCPKTVSASSGPWHEAPNL